VGWTTDQTSHQLLCGALRETVHAGPAAVDWPGSIRYRASAVLYMLLLDHPIDRWGRCRSCRRSGAMIGLRRRRCRIHARASYWLLCQPDNTLLSHLANEPRSRRRIVGRQRSMSRKAPCDPEGPTATRRASPAQQ
jgi:hypothetical protein